MPRGEIVDLESLFNSFYPTACMFAFRFLKDMDLAEDFAQEAFIELWTRRSGFSGIQCAKAYIYTVVRNKSLNYIRLKNLHDDILRREMSRDAFFYDLILEEETFQILHHAVSKLPPQTRNVIMLCLDGKMNREIADQLEVSLNTVKTLKKNAYRELRVQLHGQVLSLLLLSQLLG